VDTAVAVDACRTFLKVAKHRNPTDTLTVAVVALHNGTSLHPARAWAARLLDALGLGG
jgi:hypothetical protein